MNDHRWHVVAIAMFGILTTVFGSGCPNKGGLAADNKPKHDYQGWKVYAPAEAGFEVQFPQDPVLTKASPATGNLHMAGVTRKTPEELGYHCQWIFQKKAFADKKAELAYLEREMKAGLQAQKGKILEESETPIAGGTGRRMIVEVSPGNYVQRRWYLSGKLTVLLEVGGKDKEAVSSKNAVMFFDSLKFGTK